MLAAGNPDALERIVLSRQRLLSNVHPTSIVAQQEIFGPVLAAMTFRTPAEAVELANNTVYGLASCVWSENINVALHVAAQIKAGVVWVNCTNLFDAACGFGGYRESGYGREGGREGLLEYLEPVWFKNAPALPAAAPAPAEADSEETEVAAPGDRPHREAIHRRQAGAAGFRILHAGAGQGRPVARRSTAGKPERYPQRSRGSAQSERLGQEYGAQSGASALLHGGESLAAAR